MKKLFIIGYIIYTIIIKNIGKFSKFENNYIDKEIEITECNTVDNIYLYQSIDSPRLKSWLVIFFLKKNNKKIK